MKTFGVSGPAGLRRASPKCFMDMACACSCHLHLAGGGSSRSMVHSLPWEPCVPSDPAGNHGWLCLCLLHCGIIRSLAFMLVCDFLMMGTEGSGNKSLVDPD